MITMNAAPTILLRWVAAAALASVLPAQWATVVSGPATSRTLWTYDESQPGAAGVASLQGVEFLPVLRTGATVEQGLQALRPRGATSHGIERLEMPGARRLFHYRRNAGGTYGYLLVDTDGRHSVVLEEPASAGRSPFADRFAVAEDGSFLAVPGEQADLWLVRLDGQNFVSTGTPSRRLSIPQGIEFPGVMVTQGSVFYVDGNDRLFRVGRADGAIPVDVTPPGGSAAARVKDGFAVSGDQQTLAFLHGDRGALRIYSIGDAGNATLLPPPPADYEEPGYLPEGNGHARLLFNGDGSRLLYVDGTVRDEVYLLDVASGQSLHITQDLIFQPYIGVIILPSFEGADLIAAIGDPNLMDWFKVDAGFQVTNLTDTGSPNPPYPSGTLDPRETSVQAGRVLAFERNGAGGRSLRSIDPVTGAASILRSGVQAMTLGSAYSGAADLLVDEPNRSLLLDATGRPVVPIPAGIRVTPTAIDPSGSVRLTAVELGGGVRLPVFQFVGVGLDAGLFEVGIRQTILTNGGGAWINGPVLRYYAVGVAATQAPPGANTIFLSGAGS